MAENSTDFQLGTDFSYLGLDFSGIVEAEGDNLKLIAFSNREIDLRNDILAHYGIELPAELNSLNLIVEKLYFYLDTRHTVRFKCDIELNNETLGGDLAEIGQVDCLKLCFDITIKNEKPSFINIELSGATNKELLPDIHIERINLLFKYEVINAETDWILAGSVKVKFFDLPSVELLAAYETKEDEQLFKLAVSFDSDKKTINENEFVKIDGIKLEQSIEIRSQLKQKGYLDKSYRLTELFKPFDKGFELQLDTKYSEDNIEKIIDRLLPSKTLLALPNLLKIGLADNVADISIKEMSLCFSKKREESAAWDFSAITDLNVYDLNFTKKALFRVRHGKLRIFNDNKEKGFIFAPDKAELVLNIFKYSDKGKNKTLAIAAGLDLFSITKKEDKWTMTSGAYLNFRDVPDPLDKVFADEIQGECGISSKGFTLKINRLANPVKLDLSYLQKMGLTFNLGEGIVDIRDITIKLQKELSLSGDLAIGLPSRLNHVLFGEVEEKGKQYANTDFFKTYYKPLLDDQKEIDKEKEMDKEKESLLRLNFSIGTDGIKGALYSSPIQAIKLQDYTGIGSTESKKWIFIDLCNKQFLDEKTHRIKDEYRGKAEDYGQIKIQMPEFSFNPKSGSFKASGGYEIDQDRGLKIPLIPLIKLLEILRLGDLATLVPTSIPVKTIHLIKEEKGEKSLNRDSLKKLFRSVDLNIPAPFLKILDEVELVIGNNIIDRLPDRFVDYLSINVPESLNFHIDVTADGGVSFGLNAAGDPFQLLIPCGPYGQIMGIRLNKLAVGALFGGALLKVEIDGDLDNFNLLTLGASLLMNLQDLLPQDIKDLLPESHKFQNSFIMRDFLLVIILATEIPIPVPLFYKRLEMAYAGIDGFEVKTRISFPKPEAGILEILKIIINAKEFLVKSLPPGEEQTAEAIRRWVDEQFLLDDGQYGKRLAERKQSTLCDTSLNAGPFYIMLPRYVGLQTLNIYEFNYKEIDVLKRILIKQIKANNERYKDTDFNDISNRLSNTEFLKNQQFLTQTHFRKTLRQSVDADLEAFGVKVEESQLLEKIPEKTFNAILADITKEDDKTVLQTSYDQKNGCFVLNEEVEKSEIKKLVKYYQMEEYLEFSPIDTLINLPELSPAKEKKLGQFIGLKGNITLPSIKEIINTSLNSIKLLSINYLIESLHIDDRVNSVDLTLFYVFDINAVWMLTTPKEFSEKAHEALNRKYKALAQDPETAGKYPVITKESPANELLDLLADNDTGQKITDSTEGICIFLKGGLQVAKGVLVLESAIGLVAGGVRGFRTGVSFRGMVIGLVDINLLGFIKISPKSKTETFKLLGKSSFRVFDRQVVVGLFELTNEKLIIYGMLDLFPEQIPVVFKGYINAEISKQRFLLDSQLVFELGALKALARIYMHAEDNVSADIIKYIRDEFNVEIQKDINVLFIKILFINSELSFSVVANNDHQTQASIDVNLYMTALRLIEFRGDLNITLNQQLGFTLQGQSRLIVGPQGKPLIKGESLLIARLDPVHGFLGLQSDVSLYFCFLTSDVRLTGGLAFFSWFSGKHAGDFLLSIGGYHPLFQRPEHYPVVSRVALNLRLDKHLIIKGNAYFALTASCIMAGGRLEASWQSGGIKADFVADANFITAWKPFSYHADISVCMRLSYTFKVIIRHTLSCELGASVELWGPELSGRALVHLWRLSIPINFGSGKYEKPKPIRWREFRQEFLPQRKQQDGKDEELLKIVASGGVLKDLTRHDEHDIDWVINPNSFQLSTSSVIPVKEAPFASIKNESDTQFGIAPMNLSHNEFGSIQKIQITLPQKDVTAEFDFKPLYQNSPKALWGESIEPELNGIPMIKGCVTGFEITPKVNPDPAATTEVSISALIAEGNGLENAFVWEKLSIESELELDDSTRRDIIQGQSSKDAIDQRRELIKGFGFDGEDISLDNIRSSTQTAFLRSPQIWSIEQ